MDNLRKAVFFAGCILFALWFWPNVQMLTGYSGDDSGTIRFVLATFFSLVILLRLKPRKSRTLGGMTGIVGAGIGGAILSVVGLMFRMHQFEWLGMILVLYACLRWSLPDRWSADVVRSLFLLYWIHPLPGRMFGRFEVIMQKLSVMGGEWLLHILNVRVWAQGVYIYTGNHVFGVPEACSGMRTAVTMLICVLGVSLLLKQRWWETLVFMLLGVAQVLVINIVRITFMVIWSDRMGPAWSDTFLHDSLGIFLLVAVLLIQVEMSWWKVHTLRKEKQKEREERGEVEEPDEANTLPRILYLALLAAKWVLLALVIILGLAFAGYKRRPFHRAAMISDVVDGLMETDAAAAEAAVNDALSYTPHSRDLMDKKAHVLILRKKYRGVLEVLDKVPPPLGTFETIMKSWALMSLGSADQAIAAVDTLPAGAQRLPGVAIVKAEYAVLLDKPAEVSSNALIAAGSAFTMDRLRDIYPYLATHEQWEVIAKSNSFAVPYKDVVTALMVIQAYIKIGDTASASRTLAVALSAWPDEPRLLNALYYMAVRQPDDRWATRFAKNFISNVDHFSQEEAARRLDMAFRLNRPDLGWLAYERLRSLDPDDPELWLAPAKFGAQWFVFRCEQVGMPIKNGRETVNLRQVAAITASNPLLRSIWAKVPLMRELSGPRREMFRAKALDRSLKEFEKRLAGGTVDERLNAAYPVALGIAGRFEEAHRHLDKLMAAHPEDAAALLFRHADFYHAEHRWQESYESLRLHFEKKDVPSLSAYLMMTDDLINMNMGVYALDVLMRAKKVFVGAHEIRLAEASLWNVFGYGDRALHILGAPTDSRTTFMKAQLLFDTGRYREAERLAGVLGVRPPNVPKGKQKIALPPAELSVQNRWGDPFTKAEIAERISALKGFQSKIRSPFLGAMLKLELDLMENGSSSVEKWEAAGRDRYEKASALHRLTVLAGRQGDMKTALTAVTRALEHLPSSAMLWRMRVAMSEGDPDVVAQAEAACPDDPEIWLASLVCRLKAKKDLDQLAVDMQEAVDISAFSVETYIRAADMLLRHKRIEEAKIIARHVTRQDQESLLAADMLGLRCALATRDAEWALECALRGVEHSVDPTPFYEMVVALKSVAHLADAELVGALEHLKEAYPEDNKWREHLGMVYFEKGDTVRSLSVLNSLIKEDIRSVTSRSFLLAAESARLEGENKKAIEVLRAARALYPDNSMVLNNLVYSLAHSPETLDEASKLLPELEKTKEKTFHVYDTIATVHMKNGRLREAQKYMEKSLDVLEAGGYSANEVKLNSAEILITMGEVKAAEARIRDVQSDADRSPMVDRRARALLERIAAIKRSR